jgi:hypothetical protein
MIARDRSLVVNLLHQFNFFSRAHSSPRQCELNAAPVGFETHVNDACYKQKVIHCDSKCLRTDYLSFSHLSRLSSWRELEDCDCHYLRRRRLHWSSGSNCAILSGVWARRMRFQWVQVGLHGESHNQVHRSTAHGLSALIHRLPWFGIKYADVCKPVNLVWKVDHSLCTCV